MEHHSITITDFYDPFYDYPYTSKLCGDKPVSYPNEVTENSLTVKLSTDSQLIRVDSSCHL